MEERIDRIQRLAKIWWQSRAEGKKSQEYMAMALGVSKKTIQNWEKGISSPDVFQSMEWFRILGLNPMHYFMEYLYPQVAEKGENIGKARNSVHDLVDNMTANELKEMLFLMMGDHGSSWQALLEMMTAYCHLPLTNRVLVGRMVLDQYDIAEATDTLVCPDSKLPVTEFLATAVDMAKESVCDGKSQYTMMCE